MIVDIVNVIIAAVAFYSIAYGFYAVFTDLLKGKKK